MRLVNSKRWRFARPFIWFEFGDMYVFALTLLFYAHFIWKIFGNIFLFLLMVFLLYRSQKWSISLIWRRSYRSLLVNVIIAPPGTSDTIKSLCSINAHCLTIKKKIVHKSRKCHEYLLIARNDTHFLSIQIETPTIQTDLSVLIHCFKVKRRNIMR